MNDDELRDLFSAFDEVSTPDSMKASALDFIMAASAAGGAAAATSVVAATTAETAEAATAAATTEHVAAHAKEPQFVATSSRKRRKSKWNAIRVAAVAACLALALTGGAAYALSPVSIVTITQGNTTIEVSANLLGMVSVNSNNDTGREIIGAVDINGLSLDDSVAVIRDTLVEFDGETTVTVVKRSNGVLETSQTDGKPAATANDGKIEVDQPADKQTQPLVSDETNSGESVPASQPVVSDYNPVTQPDASELSSDNSPDPSDQSPGGENDKPADPDPVDDPVDDPVVDPVDDPTDDPSDDPVVDPEPEEPPLDDQGDGDDGWEPPELYDQGADDEPEPELEPEPEPLA